MAKTKKAAETVEKVAKKVTKKAKEVAETVTRGVFTQRGK